MSSIDERIVKMTFDNEKFESGVRTTLDSLEGLKKGLNFTNIENGVASLQKRFSTMGIVGMEITRRLTNAAIDSAKRLGSATIGQIKSGGMTRALNIEQARFQLQGLFSDLKNGDEQVEKVMNSALNAVKGTAYGLDEAAKAASVLAASGVGMDKMEPVLTSIAGAAAMTGRNYSDVADIYSTVASNGKLMTMQLRQFSAAGLNVSAVLRDYYGKTEAEINEMVQKGEVSFEDFSEAMLKFGKQAKRANETFSGSLANMKAALSRIGAQFATPYLENARDVFNALTPAIDEVGEALKPFAQTVSRDMEKVKKAFVTFLNFLSGDTEKHIGPLNNLFSGLVNIVTSLKRAVSRSFGEAFKDIFPNATLNNLGEGIKRFREISEILGKKLTAQTGNLKDGFAGLFTIFKAVGKVIGFLASALDAITKPFGGLIGVIGGLIGIFGRAIQRFYNFVSGSELLSSAAENIIKFLGKASQAIHDFATNSKVLSTVNSIIHGIGVGLSFLGDVISGSFTAIKNTGIFDKLAAGLGKIKDSLSGKSIDFSSIFGGMSEFFNKITGGFSKVINFLSNLDFGKILNAGIATGITTAILRVAGAFDVLIDQLTHAKNGITVLPTAIKDITYQIRNNMKAYMLKEQAKALLIYAASIGILAFSISKLAKIDSIGLAKGLASIGLIMKMLNSSLANMEKTLSGKNSKGIIKASASLIFIALAVKTLSKAVEKLAQLNLGELTKGLIGVGVILTALGIFLNKTDFKGFGVTKGLGLMAVAESLNIMSKAVEKLGNLSIKQLAKGLVSVGVLLTAISGALRLAGNPKHMVAMGLGLVLMAASISVFSKSVDKLGGMNTNNLIKGLGSLAAILVMLTAAIKLMPGGKALAIGAALTIMSVGILGMSAALMVLSKIPLNGMLVALLGVVGVLGSLAIVTKLVNPISMLGISAAMLIFAAALVVLTPALLAFSKLSLEGIGKALLLLAGVFLVLGGAAALLTPLILPMIGLAAAITLLGVGVTVTAAGLMLLAAAFTALAVAGTAGAAVLVEAIKVIVTGLITMIPEIATAAAEAIVSFAEALAAGAPRLMAAAITIGSALIDGLLVLVPKIANTGVVLILSLLSGIAQNIGMIAALGMRIIVEFINGISKMIGPLIDSGMLLILSFIVGLADSIRNNSKLFFDALASLCEAMLEMFISALETMAKGIPVVGKKISKGLEGIKEDMRDAFDVEETTKKVSEGVDKNLETVRNAAPGYHAAGTTLRESFTGSFDSLGLDMATIGEDGVQGLLNSIAAGGPEVGDAGLGLDQALIDGLQSGEIKPEDVMNELMAGYGNAIDSGGAVAAGKAKNVNDQVVSEYDKGDGKVKKSGEKKASAYAAGITPKDVLNNIKAIMTVAATAFNDKVATQQVKNSGSKVVETFASGITSQKQAADKAGKQMAGNAASGTNDKTAKSTANTAGIDLGRGYVQGINAKKDDAYDAGYALGKRGAQGVKDGEKSKSPSKLAIQAGEYLGQGLVIGINSMVTAAYNAGYNLGDKTSNALTVAMSKVYDVLDADLDMNPTITPVLDLSNIQNGANRLDSMFGLQPLNYALAGVGAIDASMSSRKLASQSTTTNSFYNTFNITVDGTESPVDFANELVNQIEMQTRMS